MKEEMPSFNVPIVSPELNQEEMILQIADSLDYLSVVAKTVFECINAGISRQSARLNDINVRGEIVKSKIEKLTGSRSATKVFSAAKYPAGIAHKSTDSIFLNVKQVPYPIQREVDVTDKNKALLIDEKLQFFHVRDGQHQSRRKNGYNAKNIGLGSIPSNLESVSSLLLFNTSEIPYKNYVTMDPMKTMSRMKQEEKDNSKRLEDAPQSIAAGDHLSAQMPESYLYLPSLGEVPVLDVPMDLPDLPGIADDLRYAFDIGPGFAPSVASTPAIPELPSIVPDLPEIVETSINTDIPPIAIVPPPPMPPPPPPLPPMPPPQVTELPPINKVELLSPPMKNIDKPEKGSTDARMNLMDAIRKAGGSNNAKLRSVRMNQDEVRRKKEEKAIAAGGDLMADLHNRLLMRRKGISGDKPGGGTAMDKVSAMIPPPPVNNDTSSATEEDDWD